MCVTLNPEVVNVVCTDRFSGFFQLRCNFLGTQKAHKHKHFMGISLPYWASFLRGVYMGDPYPYFCLCAFFWGPNFRAWVNRGAPG